MPVENGRSWRFPVYHDGRGQEPVTVVGRSRSRVAVSTVSSSLGVLGGRLLRLEDYAPFPQPCGAGGSGAARRGSASNGEFATFPAPCTAVQRLRPVFNRALLTSERVKQYGTPLGAGHAAVRARRGFTVRAQHLAVAAREGITMHLRIFSGKKRLAAAFAPVLASLLVIAAGVQTASAQKLGATASPSGPPIVVGSTLSLTGASAATGIIHKVAGDVYVKWINSHGGLLGRPVEWK